MTDCAETWRPTSPSWEAHGQGSRAEVPLGKVLFAGAVEIEEQQGFGRARLGVIPDASTESLAAFLESHVEPGSCMITDSWSAYPAATRGRYTHLAFAFSSSGQQAHEVLPCVHLVSSLVKRWILGTLQGSVIPEHVQAYLDGWVFRFNRRNSRSRGLLFHMLLYQAIEGGPVSYKSLRKTGRTRPAPPPANSHHASPPSLDMEQHQLSWRE